MFGKIHIHRYGKALCHASGGSYINFDVADGMSTDNCCNDCQRRYRNITGINLQKAPIDKAMLRAKTLNT